MFSLVVDDDLQMFNMFSIFLYKLSNNRLEHKWLVAFIKLRTEKKLLILMVDI